MSRIDISTPLALAERISEAGLVLHLSVSRADGAVPTEDDRLAATGALHGAATDLRVVGRIVDIVFPGGDLDHEGGSEVIGDVANELNESGAAARALGLEPEEGGAAS